MNNKTRWQQLLDVARKVQRADVLPRELDLELTMALVGVECMQEITTGMIGNLVDDSHIKPMWREPLADEQKDKVVQAVWEWYAAHTERALAERDDDDKGIYAAYIGANLKFDGLMRLLDSLVDERIAGAWKDLLK